MRCTTPSFVSASVLCLALAAPALAPVVFAAPGTAETAMMRQAEPLRRQPRSDAVVLARLPAGASVDVLDSRPGWLRVAGAAGTGWVRMFGVARAADATEPMPAPADTAAATRGPTPATAPARASRHALILGIGQFSAPGIPPLPGVAHDLLSAQDLARSMGVAEAQTTVLRDNDLTLAGMVRALQQLVARVQPGDRVFLYYSGHGTRYLDIGRPGSPCVTSLVAHDGTPFTDSMMAEALQQLADKADKLFVFVDACFSGGTVSPARGIGPTPKFFARSGVAAQCGTPSNVVTRSLDAGGARRWASRDNLVYLTAARDTEIAFEEAGTGGFATGAFHACTMRDARDLDGSGNLSIAEIARCAQQRIDARLAGSRDFKPHHLTVFGNRDFIPAPSLEAGGVGVTALTTQQAAPQEAPTVMPSAAAPTAPPSAPPTAPPGAPPVAPSAATDAAPPGPAVHLDRTLRDIHAQRDDRRQVSVRVARNPLRIGRDRLELTIRSSHPGHLYLLYAGSDGRSLDMLFPNRLDADNPIEAQRTVALPRAGWTIQAQGPAGSNQLLVLVADSPRDFSGAGLQPGGLFSSVAATPQSARSLTGASMRSAANPSGACAPPARCSNAYGSALIEVRELP